MARVTIALFILASCSVCIWAGNDDKCGPHGVFDQCAHACPVTCQNYYGPRAACSANCVARCRCTENYILNNEEKCVSPSEC